MHPRLALAHLQFPLSGYAFLTLLIAVLQQCTTLTSAKHSADPAPFLWIVYFAAFQEPFCKYILPDAVLV